MTVPGPSTPVYFVHDGKNNALSKYLEFWREYGDFFRFPVNDQLSVYMVVHPEDVGHVFQMHDVSVRKSRFIYKYMDMVVGQGLNNTEGAQWRHQRLLAQPAFSPSALDAYGPIISDIVDRTVRSWTDGTTCHKDIKALVHGLAFQVAGRILFGQDLGADQEAFSSAFRKAVVFVNEMIMNPALADGEGFGDKFAAFEQETSVLFSLSDQLIEQRLSDSEIKSDLLGRLVAAYKDADNEVKTHELRNQVMTMLVAGHDTTSATVSWALYLLSRHPDILNSVREELDAGISSDTTMPAKAAGSDLLHRVVLETMRLYPAGWILPRETISDLTIRDHKIPAGQMVLVGPYFTHRHPEFWTEPEAFDPDRFLPSRMQAMHRYQYFPFGGGKRTCVGRDLAIREISTILRTIIMQFDLASGSPEPEVDATFGLHPAVLDVSLTPRRWN